MDLLRPLWRGRGSKGHGAINVQLRAEGALPVRGDPTELREVVTNVLKNAIEAVGEQGRITLTAARRRGRVQVRVQDDGPGVPPAMRSRVFDPFFTTKGERGTGLGLCLSQQIVEKHGGSITLDSEPGRGTAVTFQLPVADAAPEAKAPVSAAEAPSRAARAALRVVVVDDDADVLAPLCSYLEKSGYEVHAARDGAEGLEVAAAQAPDVVLTDIGMPVMDGLELCRRLHRKHPRLPVVLMSGWASDVDPRRAKAAGARAYLSKPFAMRQVTELLDDVAGEVGN